MGRNKENIFFLMKQKYAGVLQRIPEIDVLREQLYLIAVAMFIFATSFSHTEFAKNVIFMQILNGVRLLSYIVVAIKMCIDYEAYLKRWYIYMLIIMLSLVCGFMIQYRGTVMMALLVVGALNIYEKNILKVFVYMHSLCLFVTIGCAKLGVIENYLFWKSDRLRYTLGFDWVTVAPIAVAFVIIAACYVDEKSFTLPTLVMGSIASIFCYVETRTRFAMLVSIGSVLVYIIVKVLKMEKVVCVKWLQNILIVMPWLICIISVLIAVLYQDVVIWNKLDQLVNSRIVLAYQAMKTYSISLFGQPIQWIGMELDGWEAETYNYVDNSYVQILLNHGLLYIGMVLLAYSCIIKKKVEKKCVIGWVMVIIVLVFCMSEPYLINLLMNPMLYLVFASVDDKKRVVENGKY